MHSLDSTSFTHRTSTSPIICSNFAVVQDILLLWGENDSIFTVELASKLKEWVHIASKLSLTHTHLSARHEMVYRTCRNSTQARVVVEPTVRSCRCINAKRTCRQLQGRQNQ